jgi:hypothetical protein
VSRRPYIYVSNHKIRGVTHHHAVTRSQTFQFSMSMNSDESSCSVKLIAPHRGQSLSPCECEG